MFFNSFKERVHHFFVKKSKSLSHSVYKNMPIRNILVLVDDIAKFSEIKKELNFIFNSKKYDIDFLIFQNKKNKKEECNECIYPSDFGWLGSISSEKISPFLTKNYDLLINYCKIDYIYINTLLLHCKIAFRVSFSQLNNQFYDLQIDCDTNNIALFTKELNKYLTILNKLR